MDASDDKMPDDSARGTTNLLQARIMNLKAQLVNQMSLYKNFELGSNPQ